MKQKDKQDDKITITEFLESHKIWFSTVLSFALTCAAIMVSIASYNVSRHQVQLDERSLNSIELEKQPYFSIENYYIENEDEYTYIVKNTGGEVRYTQIYLCPYLYIERRQRGKQKPLDYAFIKLPDFYRNSDIQLEPNCLLAFKDYMFVDEESGEKMLADYLFSYYSSWDNLGGMDTSMNSQIVYNLQITYVDYKNECKTNNIVFSRNSDIKRNTSGNTILNIDMTDKFLLRDNKKTYTIDSFNLSDEDVVKQCEELIKRLRREFGQTEAAKDYRK